MTLENGFRKCSLFVLSANGWKDQNMASSFSRQKNPNMEKALFDWPIVLQYDVKAKYRLISRKFSGMKFFQPKAKRVCIRSINQSNRSISVHLLFLFCSRLFISRSYENRSNTHEMLSRHVKTPASYMINDLLIKLRDKKKQFMLFYFKVDQLQIHSYKCTYKGHFDSI